MQSTCKTPWESSMGVVPMHLEYSQGTMFELVNEQANKYPNFVALDFMGSKVTYTELINNIRRVAVGLTRLGIKAKDHIVIAMPNCPQAIYMFYAANYIGAIAHVIHPLSAEKELEFYINDANAKLVLALNSFYKKFAPAIKATKVKNFVVADIKDELNFIYKIGYSIATARRNKLPKKGNYIKWNAFIKDCNPNDAKEVKTKKDDTVVVLYSGGTTGTPKGIALTNYNFNALAAQIIATNQMFVPGDKMLAALPLFHGFGLGVCIHSMLASGGRCVLVPRFTAESYAKLMLKLRCNFIVGVPTLFEALTRLKTLKRANLSCLKGVFSGGDTLTPELKKKFDTFLKERKATVQIREGYGTTECVNASCLTPITHAKEGSIGIPFPDTYYKIVTPGTDDEVPFGVEGEILIAGPTVMKEYTHHQKETKEVLHKDKDGITWLHTGDLGFMDREGFIFFRGRIKRLIITSGYNVYPAQIESVISQHESVQSSCVIGVPDDYKMQRVKAFITLKKEFKACEELRDSILAFCKKRIAKYAMPSDIEFREFLPKTLVGKIAYRVLEQEELLKSKIRTRIENRKKR